MTDRYEPFDGEYRQTGSLAPENANSEQVEMPRQAQSVADDALDRTVSVLGLEDSIKVESIFGPDGAQDIVDHIEDMMRSGTIDMSAYVGEPDHDDNAPTYDWKASPITGDSDIG